MTSIKTIVIDDEMPSREALATYLRDYCPDVEVVAECETVKTAYDAIIQYNPHLIFLDIELPDGNGFDLLSMFKTINFKVIFITAYSVYAIQAFRSSATDYLLKPVKVDELVDSINKVRLELGLCNSDRDLNKLAVNAIIPDAYPHSFLIPDTNGFRLIKPDEIIMCEAEGIKTLFYLTGKRKISGLKNLKHYENLFNQLMIVRVHRSYLVNLSMVTGYSRQGEIFLKEKLRCPMGDNYRRQFLEKIGES